MVLASKPAGYWRLKETNAFDETKQNRNWKYRGAVAFGEAGAFTRPTDKSVRFDGKSAFVEIPADTSSAVVLCQEVQQRQRNLRFHTG